ncbi:MAG: D-alanine--D-alanine ligase [Planctomycetes bacterium]|nr:D-alanine--D-alanine ligase [Planctomycetota bacterium]
MKIEKTKLNVAVLAGGIGEERQVSLQSGRCVAQALKDARLNVTIADITPDNLAILDDRDIDVFFIALHGKFGEDGQLQQILEDKSLVYTGSGPAASELAFDKMAAKKAFENAGVKTPPAVEFNPDVTAGHLQEIGDKYVVKPTRQGSTVGVTITDDPESAIEDAIACLDKFGDCMIEKFIPGREITVGVLGNKPLPIIEIKPKSGFYDYHAKYIDEETEFLLDTIDSALTGKVQEDAIACFNALGLRHFARIDFIISDDNVPYVLEANTIPGLTTHSLVPKAAQKAGLTMPDLCLKIIETALENKKNSRTQNPNAVTNIEQVDASKKDERKTSSI